MRYGGVFSLRQIKQKTYTSLPFFFIAGGLHPDHDTVNSFRRDRLLNLSQAKAVLTLRAEARYQAELAEYGAAGNQSVVWAGIVSILSKEPDIHVIAETGDGGQVERLTAESGPDVLVLDVNTPGLDPMATTFCTILSVPKLNLQLQR